MDCAYAAEMRDCLAEDMCKDMSGSLVAPLVPLNTAIADWMSLSMCGQAAPSIDTHTVCDFALVGLVSDACFPSIDYGLHRMLRIPGFGEEYEQNQPMPGAGGTGLAPTFDYSSFYSTIESTEGVVAGGR